ncbi:helix-turn-helix domain-containing protein [Acinetobacter seifertii]|uniref:helix-turn-helix domain-containing protein n=1 Tax=Acinetobacter seifertii TaxID=1530123 RepID=UPI0019070A45|nr:helix-turn-helix transcriptional regulator [Acinetobacter seifertii]MBJ9425170.1 helix-turn-helix transcriptional regulator [Acinetobacter seifertii]
MSHSLIELDNKNESIGERIDRLLNTQKLDQYQLATKSGTTQATISRIMSGKVNNSKFMPAIAQALNVSVEYLIFGLETDVQVEEYTTEQLRIKENDFMLIRKYENVSENTEDTRTKKKAEDILMLEKSLVPQGSSSEDLCYITVPDHSMSPKIPTDARVCFTTKDTSVVAGKAYAIKYGTLTEQIRYLYPLPDGGMRIRVTPEQAAEFPEMIVTPEEINKNVFKVLGKVFSVTSSWI